jgi:hypothetical protein
MTEARTVVTDPALGCSYQIVLDKDARRQLVFQMHVPVDTGLDVINGMLDKIGKAADRQIAIYELQEARRFLDDHKRTAHSLAKQREEMDALAQARWEESNRKGDWNPEKMPAAEKQARHNVNISVERYREGIQKYTKLIADLEPVVNPDALNGSADRYAGESGG